MKIDLHKINQYTDTKKWYVTRLQSIDPVSGSLTLKIIKDQILTKTEAIAFKKYLDKKGLNFNED